MNQKEREYVKWLTDIYWFGGQTLIAGALFFVWIFLNFN